MSRQLWARRGSVATLTEQPPIVSIPTEVEHWVETLVKTAQFSTEHGLERTSREGEVFEPKP